MKQLLKGVHRKDRSGFTLIELLVVVAVLAILASIAVPVYLGQRTKAMTQEAKSNLEILRLLQEQYNAENGEYAPLDADSDGTIQYMGTHGTADGGLEDLLTGFKPGSTSDLKFDYEMAYVVTGGVTESFTARAAGKANTQVAGIGISLNSNNEWGAFTP